MIRITISFFYAGNLLHVPRKIVVANDHNVSSLEVTSRTHPLLSQLKGMKELSFPMHPKLVSQVLDSFHLFQRYRSARWNSPGGGRMTLDFPVRGGYWPQHLLLSWRLEEICHSAGYHIGLVGLDWWDIQLEFNPIAVGLQKEMVNVDLVRWGQCLL